MIWIYLLVSIISGIVGAMSIDWYYKKQLNRIALYTLGDNIFLVGNNTLDYIGSMNILDESDLKKLISAIHNKDDIYNDTSYFLTVPRLTTISVSDTSISKLFFL